MFSLICGLIIFHLVMVEECYCDNFKNSLSYALYDRMKQIYKGEF